LGALPGLEDGDWAVRPQVSGQFDLESVTDQYGAWPFIYGTLVSSAIALIIAVPLGVATALYLTELAPMRIRQPVIMVVEMWRRCPV